MHPLTSAPGADHSRCSALGTPLQTALKINVLMLRVMYKIPL